MDLATTCDEVGNRLTQTDANNRTTYFGHDEVGRPMSRTLPGGATELMTYDLDGTLVSRADFHGRTTTFGCDVNARLTSRNHPDTTSVTWTWTPTVKRTSYTDARGTRSYTYDALDRLETVTDSQGGVYTHTYDDVGNRSTLSYPNGVTTTTLYDPVHRLTSLSTETSVGGVLQSYTFTQDVTGRRERIDESDGSGPTRTLAYSYDPLYRLTQDRVTDAASALVYREDFVYDPVGNRTSLTRDDGGGPLVTSYAYDDRDRLLTEGPTTYAWDANGNLASKSGIATYAWDTLDRLTTTTLADGTGVVRTYDPDGNRMRTETTPPGGPTEVVDYLVDTSGALSHVIVESDGSGNVLAHYVRGDELLSLWRPASAERRYFHANGIGSVRLLTDVSETITDRYAYTAFGVLDSRTGSDLQPYQFTGEPVDETVELQYLRARWMGRNVGRFISVDPFAGVLHAPTSLHRYVYANGDPVGLSDPSGEFSVPILAVGLAIAASLLFATPFANSTLRSPAEEPVTVHIWNYRGSTEAWGHASLTLGNGVHISWWPSTENRESLPFVPKLFCAPANENQDFARDVDFEGQLPDVQIEVGCLSDLKIMRWWNTYRSSQDWCTLSSNCSTTVYEALQAGGGPVQTEFVWTPEKVENYASSLANRCRN